MASGCDYSQGEFIRMLHLDWKPSTKREPRHYGTSCRECRGRKVKCIPSNEDGEICTACLRRGADCIKTGTRSSKQSIPSVDDISIRINQLEMAMQSLVTAHQEGIVSNDVGYAPGAQQGHINAINYVGFSILSEPATLPLRRTLAISHEDEDEPLLPGQSRNTQDSYSTMTSTPTLGPVISLAGSFKHAKACKILLTALRSYSNFQDALKAHDIMWKAEVKRADPNASPNDTDITEYARSALNGDNPIKIARIGQMVATEATNLKLAENFALIVDQLIISDDEYFNTLEGLECAFHQGRIWMDVGKMDQAWALLQKLVCYLELKGFHHARNKPREYRLWRIAFQTDRFMSLLLNKAYAVDYKVDVANSGEDVANRSANMDDDMMKLAQLAGKVLDITNNDTIPAYSEVLAIDLELNHFGSLMPLEAWEADARLPKPTGKLGIKGTEKLLTHLVFLQTKMVLHLPWMLKCSTGPHFSHSRSSCLEAARHLLRLFQLIHKTEIPGLAVKHKCSPHSLIGYVAAVAVILGQMGLVASLEDPHQFQRDEALVNYALEVFCKTPTKVAEQSSSVLRELIQLRDRRAAGENMPITLTIPLIGKITIPNMVHEPSQPQEVPVISSGQIQMAMLSSWPPLVAGPIGIHETQFPSFNPPYPLHLESSSNDLQFPNSDLLYTNNNFQCSSNDSLFSGYELEHPKYDLRYPDWDFLWE